MLPTTLLSKIESGANKNPTIKTLSKIAKALSLGVDDLQGISGIGQAKALQVAAAISLVKRYYQDEKTNEIIIKNSQDVLLLTHDLRDKKRERLLC